MKEQTFKIRNAKDQLAYCRQMGCYGCNLLEKLVDDKVSYEKCPHFANKKKAREGNNMKNTT